MPTEGCRVVTSETGYLLQHAAWLVRLIRRSVTLRASQALAAELALAVKGLVCSLHEVFCAIPCSLLAAQRLLHLLNRVSGGSAVGDVEELLAHGVHDRVHAVAQLELLQDVADV